MIYDAPSRAIPTEELDQVDAAWRAANYLSVGQIYLRDNPLLKRPLMEADIKPRLLGHWGTTPGLNLVYAHANRVIRKFECPMLLIAGPGHGGPAVAANAWLEGSFAQVDDALTQDATGMQRLFQQFSFPGGIPSHAAPDIPGSIHEGGELGYSLSHAFGAAFDNPDLIVTCVVGDGEAETGPLAAAWHSNKFLNPCTDGAVIPVLHLNGYKIANPSILSRIPERELKDLFHGYGYDPWIVEGDDPVEVHRQLAASFDASIEAIRSHQKRARTRGHCVRYWHPMIILRTPKGWTGPREVDGVPVEGTARSHQVPLSGLFDNQAHLEQLEEWMRSYRPEELFGPDGQPIRKVLANFPEPDLRLGLRPEANGGRIHKDLSLPRFEEYRVAVGQPGAGSAEATRVLGSFLRDIMTENPETFRVFGPDETASNRLSALFDVTNRTWMEDTLPTDDHLAPDGRVMEILSEHTCEGWLEGYLLTGRHGLLNSYEAFIHIIASMVSQHAKWLKVTRDEIPWRRRLPSLNILLSSHVWRQDHNGFSHQDPGFVDHLVNKRPEVVRAYFPPDANTLLSVADHCLRSTHYVNLIVAGKQSEPQWLSMPCAKQHCAAGIGRWQWAEQHSTRNPELILACVGDAPTVEAIAAASILKHHLPDLAFRVVNVVDLMRLLPEDQHPHGLPDAEWDRLFPPGVPVLFAYHGYPWLIHRMVYRRTNHEDIHVHGYMEDGTTTTPLDMLVRNRMDRFHLVLNSLARCTAAAASPTAALDLKHLMEQRLSEHAEQILREGVDLPLVCNWAWPEDAAHEHPGL